MNFVTFGMMKAEFEEACAAINKRAGEAEHELLREGFKALLNGDTASRDRKCARIQSDIPVAVEQARQEAWLRIGEKHGIGRDEAMRWLRQVAN